jgi:lipoate-protein ligase A
MILWCDGAYDARENMRRDAALLDLAGAPGARFEPVLRLFRFAPEGITLGHAQRPERELDLARCERDGIPWAIRPTGGRAIFHADEWTYSLAAKVADPEWGGSLAAAYDRVARLLVAALEGLGVGATVAGARGSAAGAPRSGAASAPCFASSTAHEILRDGRKLVGSAQRRTAAALLQQGSLLLSDRHTRLADYLAIAEGSRAATREALGRAATHIGDVVGADAPLERWAGALETVLGWRARRADGAAAMPLTV